MIAGAQGKTTKAENRSSLPVTVIWVIATPSHGLRALGGMAGKCTRDPATESAATKATTTYVGILIHPPLVAPVRVRKGA